MGEENKERRLSEKSLLAAVTGGFAGLIPPTAVISKGMVDPLNSSDSLANIDSIRKNLKLEGHKISILSSGNMDMDSEYMLRAMGPHYLDTAHIPNYATDETIPEALRGKKGLINLVDNSEGIAAHEMGHAKASDLGKLIPNGGGKILSRLGVASRMANRPLYLLGGAGYNAFSGDEEGSEKKRNLVSGGALLVATPLLASEISASSLGGRALYNVARSQGDGVVKSVLRGSKAFMGVPSYIGMAAMPLMAQKAKKFMREREEKKKL